MGDRGSPTLRAMGIVPSLGGLVGPVAVESVAGRAMPALWGFTVNEPGAAMLAYGQCCFRTS